MVWTGGSQGDLAPSVEALFAQADALWPDRATGSDGTIGNLEHQARTSDHNPKDPNPPGWVDAGDLTYDPDHGVDLFAIAEAIRLRRDPRVKYVIFFGRIFKSRVDSAGNPAWTWLPYTGVNAHKSHMHVSVLPTVEARTDTSPWFEETDMALSDEDKQFIRNSLGVSPDLTQNASLLGSIQSTLKDLLGLEPGENLLGEIQTSLKSKVVADTIAAAVVAALPPASGGSAGLTEAQVEAAIRRVLAPVFDAV